MRTIPLYRIEKIDGSVIVTPVKPECEYTEMVRLVADEGKGFYICDNKDGKPIFASCLDVVNAEGHEEIEIPIEDSEKSE